MAGMELSYRDRIKSRKRIMSASHQITSAMRALGDLKYPEDSICQTCGDKRKLVAHHWNGNENAADVWFVCHRCNRLLPNGGLTLEQARERCKYGERHFNLKMSMFERWADGYFQFQNSDSDLAEMCKEEALEKWDLCNDWQRDHILTHTKLDKQNLDRLLSEYNPNDWSSNRSAIAIPNKSTHRKYLHASCKYCGYEMLRVIRDTDPQIVFEVKCDHCGRERGYPYVAPNAYSQSVDYINLHWR